MTSFLNAHPGSPAAIIPYCGKDGTPAFNTQGNRGAPHSSYASSLHASYYLGDVGGNTTVQNIQDVQNQPPIPGGRGREDD